MRGCVVVLVEVGRVHHEKRLFKTLLFFHSCVWRVVGGTRRRRHPGRERPPVPPRRSAAPLDGHVPVGVTQRRRRRRRRARHGGKRPSGTDARGSVGPSAAGGLAVVAVEGAQGRVLDGRLIVGGQGELDEAVIVLEDLGVALDTGLPVLVDAALERGLGVGDLVGVRRRVVVVEGVGGDLVEVRRVGVFAALGEQAEVLQDVVLGVGSDP